MAANKKNNGIVNMNNLDEWLCSTGFLFPENERQLERFDKLFEDYDFKLKNASIDIKSIFENNLCDTIKIIKIDNSKIENEIEQLKMVARKGQNNLPQHIIDKMKGKHGKNNNDKE
jgi:hypothetical protein